MNWLNKTHSGYIFDKRFFYIYLALTLILILSQMYAHNFDFSAHPYFICDASECRNPFYNSDCRMQLRVLFFIPLYTTPDCKNDPRYTWINSPILEKGIYGDAPPENFLFKYMIVIVILMGLFILLINHFLHNKGKKFDLELRISDTKRVNLFKLFGGIK